MEKETRSAIEAATQKARRLLTEDFREQLDSAFDVRQDGRISEVPGPHLDPNQRRAWRKITAAIAHKRAAGMKPDEAVTDFLRDAAFTMLNRFVALKMLEARELVQPCISQGEASSGFAEFCGLAPGVRTPDGSGYRLYLECVFDELSSDVKVLFDRRDAASAMWPRRATFEALLEILNAPPLASVWGEDETIGWVYQYFNGQDERRAMRLEGTPRNSRELAVRNQFFTPRYVVEFLTDNTVGRIWYEMRDGQTALIDQCEHLLRQTGEMCAPRPKKDPRDIRILDPACGSGHFLLYAFDLMLTIYQEAWADPETPRSEATGKPLAEDYPNIAALNQALPGLIMAYNLHGIDIDPRCAQICQLALWMKAQRAFDDLSIGRTARPPIRRSNIVIAEPMPGEQDLRDEFLHELKEERLESLMRRALGIPTDQRVRTTKAMADSLKALVENVWDAMSLAGEMGALVKVERTLELAVQRGRAEWEEQLPLFRIAEYDMAGDGQAALNDEGPQIAPSEGLDFWNKAERLVLKALEEYGTDARGAGVARRRLFADDAAHGFALVDLLSKKFDVALMNPPFGPATGNTSDKLEADDAGNLYSAFVRRTKELGASFIGCISDRTFMVQSTFADFREHLLCDKQSVALLADLGWGVLDANVQTAAYVLREKGADQSIGFTDLRDSEIKESEISGAKSSWKWISSQVFEKLPDFIFAYALPVSVLNGTRDWFSLSDLAKLPRGLGSNKAARTYLSWYEVKIDSLTPGKRWESLSNGGEFSPFWRQDLGVADWRGPNGRAWVEMNSADAWRPYDQSGTDAYFRRGLSFPKQSSSFHVSILPQGFLPTREGKAILFDDETNTLPILGLLNSGPVRSFVRDTCGLHKQSGAIGRIPIPPLKAADGQRLAELSTVIANAVAESFHGDETSRTYVSPSVFIGASSESSSDIGQKVREIEEISRRLYGVTAGADDWLEEAASPAFYQPSEQDVLSWSVGVAFGRFDVRVVTGERRISVKPNLFDPLPAVSPGMLPHGAPPFMPTSGIFVDDPGHVDDLVARVTAVYEHVGEPAPAPGDLRRTLARDFFPAHIRMYSKSRRKAPIYWQLATPSASYSVWLYIHAFSKDTLFRVQNDYLAPKLRDESHQLDRLRVEAGGAPSTAQSRAIEAQGVFVEELSATLHEIRRVAPLWDPELDDGVILNFAPLWRLLPQNRAWQKECRAAWDGLVKGEYDWARIAMRLWPERVVPKCAKDRSLAVAHNLEDVFWIEGADGKWAARAAPTCPIDDLIAERTSPAVKAALTSLLEAPEPVACSGRGRRRQTAA
ncbi:BREX-1 system adenine-specific DNA-methyltransferase PglX [Brevundimonas bacteroides]|uniref:BREX-1 system adenine-specific DNA-methyltransferase PglX n=1 Tax=Brevundimonas bacteroides TaxID=74311 RepID=UPI00049836BC|nr:BREX-1 system adenine-specific DNA-methyltransferase PglX [Brevundimonas bacteroides]